MLLHVHNGESSENTYLVNCQLCYRSQGCPMIVNNVVKATLSSKQRSEGFGKGKKMMASTKNTTTHFQVIFWWCMSSAGFAVKRTACMCVSWPLLTMCYVWPINGWGWANMAVSCMTDYGESNVLLLTSISELSLPTWLQCGGETA